MNVTMLVTRSKGFDPRPRTEGDLSGVKGQTLTIVSIHALVRRAAIDRVTVNSRFRRFDPRPRTEGGRSPSNAFRSLEKSDGQREPPSSSCQTVPRLHRLSPICLSSPLLARSANLPGDAGTLTVRATPLSGPRPRRPARHRRRRWCGALATVSMRARAGGLSSPRVNLRRSGRADERGEAASGKDACL